MQNEKQIKLNKKAFMIAIAALSLLGFALRWSGIRYVGVDYDQCLSSWYQQLKEAGNLKALAEFEGNYNLPYATALLILTWIPVEPIIGIKMLSIFFDYVSAGVLAAVVMLCCGESDLLKYPKNLYLYGAVTYGLVLCCPITVWNSGYLAQSDGIYAALAFVAFWCILRDKPARGMIAFGCAISMKLQAAFAIPILGLLYWRKKKFSAWNVLWIPATVQILCIPAILAGCGWDIAIRVYKMQAGQYPFMYYFYPNVWTFFQEMPYYAFGRIAISMTLAVLTMFCILAVSPDREPGAADYLEYFVITAMTCSMFLPCMHERYNYIAEVLILALAVVKPRIRIPAVVLLATSAQCYGQCFLGWFSVSPYLLAACNIGVYAYMLISCVREIGETRKGQVYAEN